HEVDARSLDILCSDRGRVRRVTVNRNDDLAVRVLPAILLYDASIRNVLGHVEHRARMMSGARTSRAQQGYDRDDQTRNGLLHPDLSSNHCEHNARSFRQQKGTIRANCGARELSLTRP